MEKPEKYKDFIDCMVDVCHEGQGNISARRVVNGVWNNSAKKNFMEDQYIMNKILKKLSKKEQMVLAAFFSQEFESGVFETLKYLEEFEIEPFIGGYEGSPYHDFIGRVAKEDMWEWPT